MSFKSWQLDPANFSGNPFVGDPRPEHDEAWNGLMQNIHLRITADEYEKIKPQIDRETAQLSNGQGYIVGFGVYHELHCLKWIRHWIHRDVYWPELEGEALEERKWHIGKSSSTMNEVEYQLIRCRTLPGAIPSEHDVRCFTSHIDIRLANC